MTRPEDNAAPPTVGDHPFTPTNKMYWGLCGICKLAAAAHESSAVSLEPQPTTDQRTELGKSVTRMTHPPEERPNPLPVSEIDLSDAQEHMLKRQVGEDGNSK